MARPHERMKFMKSLSIPQANDCLLLMEWFRVVQYCGAIDAIQSKSFFEQAGRSIESRSRYHTAMHSLWQLEFFDGELSAEFSHQRMWLQKRAINLATAYRTALEWYCRTTQHLVQDDPNSSQVGLDCLLPFTLSPRIDLTPWLAGEKLTHLPHYLWDVKSKRSVNVQHLKQPLAYMAISHTWGRFRKLDDKGPCQVPIYGVPWMVPENTRFDVRELPDFFLSKLDDVDYVWFDLFCIPQDDLRSPLALQEISRQASIFKNSSASVAWFSDVTGWAGVQAALQHYCALIIKDNSKNGLRPPGPAASLPQPPDRATEFVTAEQLNPWFTSLWTLQEMCLCPGMMFCDKLFNPLLIADNASHPLSLLDVQSIIDPKFDNDSELPKHALDIGFRFWGHFYNFDEEWNPMTILNMGNQRYCEARRAEAIMSVVGATDWFTSSILHAGSPEERMVIDKYPIAFVSEMRAKYGSGIFFSAATLKLTAIDRAIYQEEPISSLGGGIGSMLPFGNDPKFIPTSDFVKLDDDPSTADWTVLLDGKVHVTEAFVHLGLGHDEDFTPQPDMDMECRALVLKDDQCACRPISKNLGQLHEWIENFKAAKGKNYAIRVRSNDAHSEGLLLRELHSDPGVLLMVGRFILTRKRGAAWPGRKRKVDWTVL